MVHDMDTLPSGNGHPKKRIAAIDLGTNSFHAVIVDIYPDASFRVVDSLKEMISFGSDGIGTRLGEKAMQRGIDALTKIKLLSEHQGCEKIIAVATSAIREAINGGEFIQKAIFETGIRIQVIPGKTEAELIGYAVQHGLALDKSPVLIMDIGGGSTEFIIANKEEFFFLDSGKTGVARATSQFVKNDPIKKKEIEKLREFYRTSLKDVKFMLTKFPTQVLVGTSGTMQNIATMIAREKGQSTSVTLNEFDYTSEEFLAFYDKVIKMDRKERESLSGLDSKRVDIIQAGLVQVKTVIETLGISRIRTCTQALREGIILRHIHKKMDGIRMLAEYPDTRRRSIMELLRKCNWHEDHSTQVSRIALKLFDEFQEKHKLTPDDRELLEYASLLHDIGYHISHRKHHKHALYLILNSDLRGFNEEEIQVMAHVARYHRRAVPKKSHELFSELPKDMQDRIKKLSGILRVADGLDRSHYQNVIDLEVRKEKPVMIFVSTVNDPQLEIWGATHKKELFEKMVGSEVTIEGEVQPAEIDFS